MAVGGGNLDVAGIKEKTVVKIRKFKSVKAMVKKLGKNKKLKQSITSKLEQKKFAGWSYAVIRRGDQHEWIYQVHEIFPYTIKSGKEERFLWTQEPVVPMGNSLEELRHSLSMMMEDTFRRTVYEERGSRLVKVVECAK